MVRHLEKYRLACHSITIGFHRHADLNGKGLGILSGFGCWIDRYIRWILLDPIAGRKIFTRGLSRMEFFQIDDIPQTVLNI